MRIDKTNPDDLLNEFRKVLKSDEDVPYALVWLNEDGTPQVGTNMLPETFHYVFAALVAEWLRQQNDSLEVMN